MAKCTVVGNKRRKVCVGTMNRMIELNSRTMDFPADGDVDFNENFAATITLWASIETPSLQSGGITVFDESNTERTVSHLFYIRFLPGITAENWIRFENDLYDIISVEDMDNRNEFLILRCTKRGPDTVKTNEA